MYSPGPHGTTVVVVLEVEVLVVLVWVVVLCVVVVVVAVAVRVWVAVVVVSHPPSYGEHFVHPLACKNDALSQQCPPRHAPLSQQSASSAQGSPAVLFAASHLFSTSTPRHAFNPKSSWSTHSKLSDPNAGESFVIFPRAFISGLSVLQFLPPLL